MKHITMIVLVSLFLGNPMFSQDKEEQTYSTEISVKLNGDYPDSIAQKINIISDDLGMIDRTLKLVLLEVRFLKPKKISQETYDGKLSYIITESLLRLSSDDIGLYRNVIFEYINTFSLDELKQLSEFYKTDLGKKMLEVDGFLNNETINARVRLREIRDEIYIEQFGKKKVK